MNTNDSSKKKSSKKDKNAKANSENVSIQSSLSFADNNKSMENINNIKKLKEDLEKRDDIGKFKSDLDKAVEENEKISELYKNQDNIISKFKEKGNIIQLDDRIFEKKAVKILAGIYELKEYELYPYFNIGLSENKKVIKIYYEKRDFTIYDDNEKDKGIKQTILFLDDRNTYMASYQNYPMLFQKYKNEFTFLTVISPNYNWYYDFKFIKSGKEYETSFTLCEINNDLIEAQNNINITKNKIDSTNGNETEKK